MGYARTSIQLPNGIHLSYVDHGAPEAVPVLFLHGITDSSFSFSPVLPLLGSEVRAIAPDQRGHGDSDKPATGYSIEDLAGDALALLDALGIGKAVVVGHSMGSFVAQNIAVCAPERVSGLMLVGSGSPRAEAVCTLRDCVATMSDPLSEEFVREFQLSTIWRPVSDEFFEKVVSESMKVPVRVWQGCLAGILHHAPALEQISAPTLILWGDRDAVFLGEDQDRLQRRVPGAELRVVPDVGHAYHWEVPELLVKELHSVLPIPA
jgi:pimeloyl-ACP methyl ester carboxylesterase